MYFVISLQLLYFLSLISISIVPKFNTLLIKKIALLSTYTILFIVIALGLGSEAIELTNHSINSDKLYWIFTPFINLTFTYSVDALSYVFMLLTALLIPLCIISSWNNVKFNLREFVLVILTVEWILMNMFMVSNLFLFYIWFEAILIPMYFLIGIWGSRQRKTYASFMFFFYTFISSLFLLFGIFIFYSNYGSLHLSALVNNSMSLKLGLLLWPMLMIAFAVKVPMFPAHIWLPEAHVEAPTVGSVLLAGVLLKLGIFAVLRFLIPSLPVETLYYTPLVSIFALIGILYVSLTTIRQIDLKKIIAYASVAHMNYVVLGVFTTSIVSLSGSIFLMVGHGVVSAGLFFMIGFLYDRYKTRNIRYYRGLVTFMPMYAVFLFLFSLANMSFPGTCNFVGEAMILFGLIECNIFVTWLAASGIVLCAIYTIWLFNRTMYGPITPMIVTFSDLSWKEAYVLAPLAFFTLYLGLFPNTVLNLLSDTCTILLENY